MEKNPNPNQQPTPLFAWVNWNRNWILTWLKHNLLSTKMEQQCISVKTIFKPLFRPKQSKALTVHSPSWAFNQPRSRPAHCREPWWRNSSKKPPWRLPSPFAWLSRSVPWELHRTHVAALPTYPADLALTGRHGLAPLDLPRCHELSLQSPDCGWCWLPSRDPVLT